MSDAPAYALLVSDIDGTLVADNKAVPPGVVAAVKAAQARGVRVCLATGRMWQAARPFVEALGADAPAILYNGALVYDFVADRTLWTARLPRAVVRRLLPLLRSVPRVSPQLYVHGGVFAERMNPYVELYARREHMAVSIEADFERLLTEDPVKILIVGERAALEALSRTLAALPDTPITQVFSQHDYLEILPADVSKGDALPVLAGAAGVALARTVAVGDHLNDLTMLQRAGLGVAVEGSPPEVLAAADWVCPPPEREGLRVLIERVFLSGDAPTRRGAP